MQLLITRNITLFRYIVKKNSVKFTAKNAGRNVARSFYCKNYSKSKCNRIIYI